MTRPPIRPLVLISLLSAVAFGETVPLPYIPPDTGPAQWVISEPGWLQQQGNQPLFGQAGMLTVNGQTPGHEGNTGELDEKNREITFNYQPIGALKVSRRIRFDGDGVVRIVDVFENTSDREVTATAAVVSNFNFGVTEGQTVYDTRKKDVAIGWAANTGGERAVLSLFAGKGGKTLPKVQPIPNSNVVSATVPLKLGGRAKAAFVHWHGTFDTADAAVDWAAKLREGKAVSDLPADLKRCVVNVASGGLGLPEGMEVLRGTSSDVIELRAGDVLRGDLLIDGVTLDTRHARIVVPKEKLAGLVFTDAAQWVVTSSGEVYAGRLQSGEIKIRLANGQTPAVPIGRVARVGWRSTSSDLPEWKFDQPTAFFADGQRFAIAPPTEPFELLTRYGKLSLRPEQVAAVLLPRAGETQKLFLADGSRLSGVLTRQSINLVATASQSATTQPANAAVATAELDRVQLRTLPDDIGTGVATVGLLGDDIVAARLTQPLKLVTAFETLTLAGTEIRSITRPRRGDAEWLVTTADQSTFRGTPAESRIDLTLDSGVTLAVPAAAVSDYDNPNPFPAIGVVQKVEAAVRRLSGDDWKDREKAEAELVAIGLPAVSVLEATRAKVSTDVRERLTLILQTLKKDLPPVPSRLSPVPPVEP